jgi:hypothetical protein
MRQFTLEISDSVPCRDCGTPNPLGILGCEACGALSMGVPFDEFFGMVERGEVLYAQQGGLVIGRDDSADDIPMIQHASGAVFRVVGCMQGGEYLMNAAATARYRERLEEINAEKGPYTPFSTIPVTPRTSVLNVNLYAPTAFLWLSARTQFVVNRFATAKYLAELEEMNGSTLLT